MPVFESSTFLVCAMQRFFADVFLALSVQSSKRKGGTIKYLRTHACCLFAPGRFLAVVAPPSLHSLRRPPPLHRSSSLSSLPSSPPPCTAAGSRSWPSCGGRTRRGGAGGAPRGTWKGGGRGAEIAVCGLSPVGGEQKPLLLFSLTTSLRSCCRRSPRSPRGAEKVGRRRRKSPPPRSARGGGGGETCAKRVCY